MSGLKIDVKSSQDMSWLIEAANDVVNATEKDFEVMKGKKWYKRLWETITFSKDNQIRTAKGVSNLAKLQEIIVRVLVLLSNENAEISEVVKSNSAMIAKLSVVDALLLKKINRIAYGGIDAIDFNDLDKDKKAIIANLLIMADIKAERNDLSKRYVSAVLSNANLSIVDLSWNLSVLESLNRQEQELLYRMIMTNRYLLQIEFDADSEIIDNISISPKRAKAICGSILETAQYTSSDFFVTIYENSGSINELENERDIELVDGKEDDGSSGCNSNKEKNTKSIDTTKKVIEIVGRNTRWLENYFIETKSFIVLNVNKSSSGREGPVWLSASGKYSTLKQVDKDGLYLLSKSTGDVSYLFSYPEIHSLRTDEVFAVCGDIIYLVKEQGGTCTVSSLDLEKKTVNLIFRGQGSVINANKANVVISTWESAYVIDCVSHKKTQLADAIREEKRSTCMDETHLYVVKSYPEICIEGYRLKDGTKEKQISIASNVFSIKGVSIYNKKIYVLGEELEVVCPGRSWAEIICVDLQNAMSVSRKERLLLYGRAKVRVFGDGLFFVCDTYGIPASYGHYALTFYCFEKEKMITLAEKCGYNSDYKEHIFSKNEILTHPGSYFRIDDRIIFEYRDSRDSACIAISDPMNVMLLN